MQARRRPESRPRLRLHSPIVRRQRFSLSSPRVIATLAAIAVPALLGGASAVVASGAAAGAGAATSALAYSTAGADVVQRQPPPGSCHARGGGLDSLPDSRCTPGALNPAVTQARIGVTICRSGWTSTVRPPASITAREKAASMSAYGHGAHAAGFEYDHLVSLELGGAVNDPRNLWPEPDYAVRSGFYLNPKDRLERRLNGLVCSGRMTLTMAQRLIAGNWVAAYTRYG
jgi:hypothetical protein